ncbi:hypothetical protein LCGC14_2271990 [marine sediment metagenome]|uniref:Uncharacterized protein n=1 Tax=marine sediment metagenome TaxID=412755 RepID=A0A0F9F988_9ZZZZ
MPHIQGQERPVLEPIVMAADTSGQLNFQLTMVVIAYLKSHGLSYGTCNDIVGALDNCKDEFRRLVQHPYEDKKIKENGNAYPEEVLS